jgi:hypothetical protein
LVKLYLIIGIIYSFDGLKGEWVGENIGYIGGFEWLKLDFGKLIGHGLALNLIYIYYQL